MSRIRAIPLFDSKGEMTALNHIAKEVHKQDFDKETGFDKKLKSFATRAIEDHAPI